MTGNISDTVHLHLLALGGFLRQLSPTAAKVVLVCGALWFISMALVVWALFFRSRHPHHKHHHHHGHPKPTQPEPEVDADLQHHRRRRRKRRREHRQMNPTLAQTGGLPPPRFERRPEPPA